MFYIYHKYLNIDQQVYSTRYSNEALEMAQRFEDTFEQTQDHHHYGMIANRYYGKKESYKLPLLQFIKEVKLISAPVKLRRPR